MTDNVPLVLAALGGLIALFGLMRSMAIGKRKYCPGPRRPLIEWLWPPNWLAAIGCGYDLMGHLKHAGSLVPVRCSECGRFIRRHRQLQRKPRRWRFIRSGLFLTATASLILAQRFFAQTHWDDDLPTWALIQIERWFGDSTPIGVRKELRQRAWKMTPEQRAAVHAFFINDLRSDSVNENASRAQALLGGIDAEAVRTALRQALRSDDWQQRQLAAIIMSAKGEPPTPDLLHVLLEALRYDHEPGYYRADRHNATNALSYLRRHPEQIRPLLRTVLNSTDAQQRQVAARLLCEFDAPPAPRLLEIVIVDFTHPEARYEYEVRDVLFENEAHARLADYLGRNRSDAEPFLSRCLRDEQGVARAYAACLLREISPERDEELLHGLVEAFRFNRWQGQWGADTRHFMIKQTMASLIDAGPAAAGTLRLALQSDDPQQRLLAAATTGFAGLIDLAPLAVPILVEHLSDNRFGDDAVFALRALVEFGPAAQPWLEPLAASDDEQVGECVGYLLARIEGRRAVLPERKTDWGYAYLLTSRTNDPSLLRWDQLDVPRIDPARLVGR